MKGGIDDPLLELEALRQKEAELERAQVELARARQRLEEARALQRQQALEAIQQGLVKLKGTGRVPAFAAA